MEHTLHRHNTGSLFRVPEGLNELLFDISREVLREQPEQIYKFIANYLSFLLNSRENALLTADSRDKSTNESETVKALINIGLLSTEAQKIHSLLLKCFSCCKIGYGDVVAEAKILESIMSEINIAEAQFDDLIKIVRRAYVLHMQTTALTEQPKNEVTTRMSKRVSYTLNTIYHHNPNNVSLSDLNRVATKIQAAYRGYRVRRHHVANHQHEMKKSYDLRDILINYNHIPVNARDVSDASVWTWKSDKHQKHKYCR